MSVFTIIDGAVITLLDGPRPPDQGGPGPFGAGASNHAETRAWSRRSGRMFPNRGIRRPRR